jgi:hypothetical protein
LSGLDNSSQDVINSTALITNGAEATKRSDQHPLRHGDGSKSEHKQECIKNEKEGRAYQRFKEEL